ncbi:MAG: hypothetical protein JSR59_20660 [Proteobacteria bacterium]|nr:hypothetical protein [Pseudomonadota bacterium]
MDTSDLAWLVLADNGGVGQRLGLLEAVLPALQTLRQVDAALGGWSEALAALSIAVDTARQPDAIEAAAWQAVTSEWTALQTRFGGPVAAALRPLTLTLRDFAAIGPTDALPAGTLVLPLIARAARPDGVSGGLVFAADAEAGAALELQVSNRVSDAAAAAGDVLPAGRMFVRLGLRGGLAAGGSAGALPVWGHVGAHAGASASASLDWCLHDAPDRCMADVLLDAIAQMARPGDLAGLMRGTQPALCIAEIDGTLAIGGELEIGSSFVAQAAAPAANSGLGAVTIDADIGLKAGFAWGVEGRYRSVVQRDAGHPVRLRIERLRGTSASTSIALDIAFDVQGLQARLDPILARALPASADLVARLGPLADLRGLALAALQRRLGAPAGGGWKGAAEGLLQALLAPGSERQTASVAFAGQLADQLDALARAQLAGAQQQVGEATAALTAALGVALGGTPLSADATSLVGALADAIDTDITAAYGAFAVRASQGADAVAGALAVAGDRTQAFIAGLQQRTDAEVGVLVQWITRYEALRARVAGAIAQVERAKLAISWMHAGERERGTQAVVEVAFSAATPAACALYAALCAGQLDGYAAALQACAAEHSASGLQWTLTDEQTRRSTDALTFSFFGLDSAAATTTTLDSIAVSVDQAGRIVGASDHVQLEQVLQARGRLTRASIDLSLEMLAADRPAPLSSTFTAGGDAFSLKDASDFFGLLTDAGAVGSGVPDQVRQLLWGDGAAPDATVPGTELSVLFEPDDDGWKRLLALAPGDLELAMRSRCMALLELAARRGDEHPWPPGPPGSWLSSWLADARLDEPTFWRMANAPQWSGFYNRLVERLDDALPSVPSASQPRGPAQVGVQTLWQIAHIARGAADAWGHIATAVAVLGRLPDGLTRAEAFRQLADASDQIRDGLAQVFSVTLADRGKPAKVNWQYLALITTLAQVASGGGAPPRLLTRAQADVGTEPVAYLIG